jgi:biotin carboxyl carrier protein
MTELAVLVDGAAVDVPDHAVVEWVDRVRGLALVRLDGRVTRLLVEKNATGWFVVLAGRRVAVEVRTARERLIAASSGGAAAGYGPARVLASLPGLVREVAVEVGATVAHGERLVVLEAMKMQNEIRSPRAGMVLEVAVAAGQTVGAGALLIQIGDRAAVQSPPNEPADLP